MRAPARPRSCTAARSHALRPRPRHADGRRPILLERRCGRGLGQTAIRIPPVSGPIRMYRAPGRRKRLIGGESGGRGRRGAAGGGGSPGGLLGGGEGAEVDGAAAGRELGAPPAMHA